MLLTDQSRQIGVDGVCEEIYNGFLSVISYTNKHCFEGYAAMYFGTAVLLFMRTFFTTMLRSHVRFLLKI